MPYFYLIHVSPVRWGTSHSVAVDSLGSGSCSMVRISKLWHNDYLLYIYQSLFNRNMVVWLGHYTSYGWCHCAAFFDIVVVRASGLTRLGLRNGYKMTSEPRVSNSTQQVTVIIVGGVDDITIVWCHEQHSNVHLRLPLVTSNVHHCAVHDTTLLWCHQLLPLWKSQSSLL